MTARTAIACWLGCAVPAVAQAPAPAPERAFVEVQAAATTVYLQQAFDLVVRIGIDAQWFGQAAVPLFQQRLDQPFQLSVPWLAGAEDRAVSPVVPAAGAAGQRIAVGDRVVVAANAGTREVDGRRFDLLELRYRWLPLAAGTSTIAPVELRYAFATRFDDDFLRGRQPLDRHEHSVRSAPLALRVRALPVAGRPPGFTGAVGEFAVTATAAVDRVTVGATFDLVLAIAGDGNLDRIAAPTAPVLPGFHVQGVREARGGPGRTFVFSVLALRAGVAAVPAIEFAAFSPAAGEYVLTRTAPVPLQVAPLPDGAVLPPAIAQLVRDDAEAARAANAWPWWSYAIAVAAVALGAARWQRRRRRAQRRRQLAFALRACAAALDQGAPPAVAAFEQLCARCAGAAEFAGEATWRALPAGGCDAATLAAAQDLWARLDAARFGGTAPASAEVLALARALVAAAQRQDRMREEGVEPSRPLPARGF